MPNQQHWVPPYSYASEKQHSSRIQGEEDTILYYTIANVKKKKKYFASFFLFPVNMQPESRSTAPILPSLNSDEEFVGSLCGPSDYPSPVSPIMPNWRGLSSCLIIHPHLLVRVISER